MSEHERDEDDLLDDPEAEETDDTENPEIEEDPSLAGNSPEDKEKYRGG